VTDTPAKAGPNIPGVNLKLQRRLGALLRLLGAVSPALAARLAVRVFTTPRARTVSAQDSAFLAGAISRRLARISHGRSYSRTGRLGHSRPANS